MPYHKPLLMTDHIRTGYSQTVRDLKVRCICLICWKIYDLLNRPASYARNTRLSMLLVSTHRTIATASILSNRRHKPSSSSSIRLSAHVLHWSGSQSSSLSPAHTVIKLGTHIMLKPFRPDLGQHWKVKLDLDIEDLKLNRVQSQNCAQTSSSSDSEGSRRVKKTFRSYFSILLKPLFFNNIVLDEDVLKQRKRAVCVIMWSFIQARQKIVQVFCKGRVETHSSCCCWLSCDMVIPSTCQMGVDDVKMIFGERSQPMNCSIFFIREPNE